MTRLRAVLLTASLLSAVTATAARSIGAQAPHLARSATRATRLTPSAIPATPASAARADVPKLVVLITVDQMRPDYFERFGSQLTGGLARLYRGGAVYTNAYQDHAISETAPGHASTLSGRFPQHTGIVRNLAGVQDANAPLINSSSEGASPARFRGSTLIDWMRTTDPRSRALSVSRKDRGAILPLGRAHQSVFFYGWDGGRFTTSRYYADTLPTWVNDFNARNLLAQYVGKSWTPLLPLSDYPEPDSVTAEANGRDIVFPHVLSANPAAAANGLVNFPWMDEISLQLALAGVNAQKLGAGPATDLLAVSLSSTDAVGHKWGIESREMHDQIVRLDRSLGVFLDSLYKLRDSTKVVIALTADHAMAPNRLLHFPGTDPNRGLAMIGPVFSSYRQRLAKAGVDSTELDSESGAIFLDRAAVKAAGLNYDSFMREFTSDLRKVPGVLRIDMRGDLAAKAAAGDPIARRWVHQLPDDLPAVATMTLQPNWFFQSSTYPTHGSPHDYDTHVPLIFYGPAFKPGKYDAAARVVDLAPTLARVLRVRPTEALDGRALTGAIR